MEKDKYAWCLGCYEKRYSSKCKKCKKPVTETVVKALGAEWHVECFCCVVSDFDPALRAPPRIPPLVFRFLRFCFIVSFDLLLFLLVFH